MSALELATDVITAFDESSLDHHDGDHDHEYDIQNDFLYFDMVSIGLIILSDVLIVLCNLFLLHVLRQHHIHDMGVVDVFLYRVMAVIDITGGFASTAFQFYSEPNFFNRNSAPSATLCLTLLFCCFYFANLSAWLQCLLTINKVILISRPLRYLLIVSVKRAAILLSVSAVVSLNCSAFLPLPSFPYTNSGLSFCRDGIFDRPSLSIDLGILVACIACPAVITSALNVHLLVIALKHTRTVSILEAVSSASTGDAGRFARQGGPLPHGLGPRRRGISTVVFLVITSYFYVIFSALYVITHPMLLSDIAHSVIASVLYLLSLSSFWWKLFVLIITDSQFRKTAKVTWAHMKETLLHSQL